MLQTLTSSPDHAGILTMDGVENGLMSERQHDIEMRLFGDACLNSFTSFKDFADFSKRIFFQNSPKWLLLAIPLSSLASRNCSV